MAKTALIAKDGRRRALVTRYAARRAALKQIIRTGTPAEREAAVRVLSRLPRDGSPVRVRNRDAVDGRPRGFLRQAGISRVRFRAMAHRGELPGITKSSW